MSRNERAGGVMGFVTRRRLEAVVPVLRWAPGYRRDDLGGDLAAGLTVAAMLIPQAMAYAMLAGLPPEVGLYASTVPLVAYAVFGTSRQLAVGPVAIVSLLTATALGQVAVEGTADAVEAAAVLALLVGLVSMALGVGRLGFVTNLLSHPVLVGYTAAAAIIIGFSQAGHLFGVTTRRTDHFHSDVLELIGALGSTSWVTVGVALGSVVVLLGTRRWFRRLPGALITVVIGIAATRALNLAERGVSVVGDIPADLPRLSMPRLDAGLVGALLPTAVIIAMIGFLESIAVAKIYARRSHHEVEPNRELVGLGAANLAAGLFGGYPVTGGFSRTAVNANAGARTPLASVITVALLLIALVALTPLFADIPHATLAAIVVVAVTNLFDTAEARRIARVSRTDLATLVFAFVSTLVLGIEWGVLAAATASLGLIIARIVRPHTAELGRVAGSHHFRNIDRFPDAQCLPGLAILRIDVSLSYLNSTFLKRRLARLVDDHEPGLSVIVLDFSGVNAIDSTAEHTLAELEEELARNGINLHLASVKGPVRDVLTRSGIAERLGPRLHLDVDEAVNDLATGSAERRVRSGVWQSTSTTTSAGRGLSGWISPARSGSASD